MLWIEAEIARERINDQVATQSILIHAAIVDAIAGGNHLNKAIEKMRDE